MSESACFTSTYTQRIGFTVVKLSFAGGADLRICAPGIGGIRIYPDKGDFFAPEKRKAFSREVESAVKTVFVTTGNSVALTVGADWRNYTGDDFTTDSGACVKAFGFALDGCA